MVSDAATSNVISSNRELLPSLRQADQRVARVNLNDPSRVADETIDRGETEDTVRSLRVTREHGSTTVAVTNHPRSWICGEADIAMFTSCHEVSFRAAATSSRQAQLTIVDCICMGLAQRTFDASRKALGETVAVHGELLGE